MQLEKYIRSVCQRCKTEASIALSDILKKKSPENGIPANWKYVGDFVDYCPYFLLCNKCLEKWYSFLQTEIEKFVKDNQD